METRDMPEIRFENDVPWKRNRFGELYRKSDERNNGQFGWNKTISIATMTWNETGNGAADSSLASYKVLRTGDIAFEGHTNKEFQFGRFVLNDIGDGITSSIFTILRPTTNQNIIFWKYLIHDEAVMRRKLVYSTKSGIMMNGLVVDDFMKQTIRFPSLPVQREIADLFSSLDRKLAAEQKKLAALKMAKHALFVKIFPREGETVPEIRFEGFSHPWEQRKLSDLAESFEYGLNASAKEYDGSHKYIRITDIDDSTHEFLQSDLTSSDADLSQTENYQLHYGDILFARTGASVGKTYIYRESDGLVYYAGFLIRAKIKMDYDPEFVFQNTLTPDYDKYIHITSQRSGQPGVNAQEYGEYSLMVPSLPEQRKIGDFLRGLDILITLHQRKCDKLRQAKSALLNQMFV